MIRVHGDIATTNFCVTSQSDDEFPFQINAGYEGKWNAFSFDDGEAVSHNLDELKELRDLLTSVISLHGDDNG